jgi:chorismate mutase
MEEFSGLVPWKKWFGVFDEDLLVISGPCSAETRDQVLETARALSSIRQVKVLRAGIWKPRTRPDRFEGVGERGLKWLLEAKQDTGLLLAVEVASPRHITRALEHQVDMIWLGARTTSNPFSVQEIASRLQGVDIPVLVKNPLHPDFNLWVGALERLYQAGVKKMAAVHRGFYPFEATRYRNIPKWEIPIELKRQFPALPVICDPSHMGGEKALIKSISQKALDLNMEGLMIETHPRPPEALSDPHQQLKPDQLRELLGGLKIRHHTSGNRQFTNSMESLRERIDVLDNRMLEIMARRMEVVQTIGQYKKDNRVTILQMQRWQNMLKNRIETGIKLGLNRKFLNKLMELIHNESIQKQNEIMNEENHKED